MVRYKGTHASHLYEKSMRTLYLQVQVFGALEGVVFISYGGSFAESASLLFSGGLGVSA